MYPEVTHCLLLASGWPGFDHRAHRAGQAEEYFLFQATKVNCRVLFIGGKENGWNRQLADFSIDNTFKFQMKQGLS